MPLTKHHSLKGLLKGLLLGSVALLAMNMLATSALGAKADKIKVCHRPPDNPSNFHIIEVAPAAVDDHLAHGDTLVMQEVCNGVDDDCDGVIDNNLTTLGTCTVSPGTVCAGTGPLTCIDGLLVCTAAENPDCVCPTACSTGVATALAISGTIHGTCGFASTCGAATIHIEIDQPGQIAATIVIQGGRCNVTVTPAIIVNQAISAAQQEACAETIAPLLVARGFTCNITPP